MEIRRQYSIPRTERWEHRTWNPNDEERRRSLQQTPSSTTNSPTTVDPREQWTSESRFAELMRGHTDANSPRPVETSSAPQGREDLRQTDVRFSDQLKSTQKIVDGEAFIVREDKTKVGSNQEIRWENATQYEPQRIFEENSTTRFAQQAPVSATEASGQTAAYSLARVLAMNGTPSLSLYV